METVALLATKVEFPASMCGRTWRAEHLLNILEQLGFRKNTSGIKFREAVADASSAATGSSRVHCRATLTPL